MSEIDHFLHPADESGDPWENRGDHSTPDQPLETAAVHEDVVRAVHADGNGVPSPSAHEQGLDDERAPGLTEHVHDVRAHSVDCGRQLSVHPPQMAPIPRRADGRRQQGWDLTRRTWR